MKNRSFFKNLSISTTWLWLGIFAIVPNLALILVSFLDNSETGFFIPELTFDNFLTLFSPVFLTVIYDSFYLALLCTFFCLVIGYPFAYIIARAHAKFRPWLLLLVVIPFWTNSLIRTYALILMLGTQGIINKILLGLGVINEPLIMMYTQAAVFIGLVYTFLPFMVLPLYASIEKLDPKLSDAARDLGAGMFSRFWHITLPLTLPGIAAGCILVFLPALGCFYVPEILGGATELLLGSFIKNQFLVANNWPLGAAASSVLTILLAVIAIIYNFSNKRKRANSKKGEYDEDGLPASLGQGSV